MELTPRCARALQLAQAAGQQFGDGHVTGAHLLLGLLDLRGGVVGNFFRHDGITREMLVDFLSAPAASPEQIRAENTAVSMALACAGHEAASAHSPQLGTEHLFVGLLAGEGGEAARLLETLGVDRMGWLQEMRRELARA